ncbi:hypothetical protein KJ870_00635 [bacterium]|nr:hypothetical protein [bacterium]MBU1433436.1 hypothetical protein [bacterium]MBU1503382.1 hypothetical protein [bacterium]
MKNVNDKTRSFTEDEKFQVELLKNWISEYVTKFKEKRLERESVRYASLVIAIDFSQSDTSLNMVKHLYKLRAKIQLHIDEQNFNSEYKKLNEKLTYQMNKMINKIYQIDLGGGSNPNTIKRMFLFKDDMEIWTPYNNRHMSF